MSIHLSSKFKDQVADLLLADPTAIELDPEPDPDPVPAPTKLVKPFRVYQGSTKPHEPFWSWRNAADPGAGSEPELELYGYISEWSWLDDDITPAMFKKDLYARGEGGPITLRLNSYGGDVIAASLINNMIRDYPGRVTVRIDGVAASAATVVAIAGDVVKMADVAYFMIHDPLAIFLFAALNIEDLDRLTQSLKAIKSGIINAYETKTGLSRSRLDKLMTDETWMDAQKAFDLGFVDEILKGEPKQIFAPPPGEPALANSLFLNVPPELLSSQPEVDTQRDAEISLLRDHLDAYYRSK